MASLEIQNPDETSLLKLVFSCIVGHRQGRSDFNHEDFHSLIYENVDEICDTFNTRWLISICDTFADSPHEGRSSKAVIIIVFVNMIKLWGTDLSIRDSEVKQDLVKLSKVENFEIWDGVITMSLSKRGDMFLNMMKRQGRVIEKDLTLFPIYSTIVKRLLEKENPLKSLIDLQR